MKYFRFLIIAFLITNVLGCLTTEQIEKYYTHLYDKPYKNERELAVLWAPFVNSFRVDGMSIPFRINGEGMKRGYFVLPGKRQVSINASDPLEVEICGGSPDPIGCSYDSEEISLDLEAGHTYLVNAPGFKYAKHSMWTHSGSISSIAVYDLGTEYKVPRFSDRLSAINEAVDITAKQHLGKIIYDSFPDSKVPNR